MGLGAADKPRVEDRVRTMVRARMRDSDCERDVCIIDVSTRGLLATAARPPKRGDFVEIQLGRNRLAGQVKWSGERRFGLSLRERVSIPAMIEGGSSTVELARSPASKRRGSGQGNWMQSNPQMFGRLLQAAFYGLAALSAAYLIAQTAGAGFAPLHDAVDAMNGHTD